MGVGSQTASIRSASIGPFGSLTPSGELLKLLVSEFQSSFVSKLPLPFLATLLHMDSHWVKPQPPVRRSRTLGAKQVLPRKSPKLNWWPGAESNHRHADFQSVGVLAGIIWRSRALTWRPQTGAAPRCSCILADVAFVAKSVATKAVSSDIDKLFRSKYRTWTPTSSWIGSQRENKHAYCPSHLITPLPSGHAGVFQLFQPSKKPLGADRANLCEKNNSIPETT
jgi:hypothetical protein